jgi:hypothetical protein
MKFLLIGKLRVANGTLRTIENGKQKIQIDSSITLRRPKMIKWIKTQFKRFWDFLNKNG